MTDKARIDDPEELGEFTATTTASHQLPAAVSPIDSLHRSQASTSNQVLATIQGEGIQIYSTTDSKCLRSWTFPPGLRFACPAKYLAKYNDEGEIGDSYVYAVLDSGDGVDDTARGAVVWRWTDKGIGSVGLEDKLSATFSSSIFALVPGATAGDHMLAIHRDGSLTLADESLGVKCQLQAPVSGAVETIWYQIVQVSLSMRSYLDSRQVTDWLDGDVRLGLVLLRVADPETSGAYTYSLSLVVVDGGEANITEVGTTHINPAHLEAQPLACAFDADTGTVAVLSEAGVYVHLSLSIGNSALDDPITLERTKETVLRGFVPCTNDGTPGSALAPSLLTQSQLTMAALTERYVAIAGTHSVISHASKGPYESVLTIWDLQYGCLHAEKTLDLAPAWLEGKSAKKPLPRLTYQIQALGPRLNDNGMASDHIPLAITVAHTTDYHTSLDGAASKSSKRSKRPSTWGVKMFVTSAFLPPVTLLASMRLQNNAKYYVDPEEQSSRMQNVHSSNILLHEEQEQGLGMLRSGWEAIVDGMAPGATSTGAVDTVEVFERISRRREATQSEENRVLLSLASVSDGVDSDQYTQRFMEHVGVNLAPGEPIADAGATWISAHLMTTVMRRCFAEPLGVSRSAQLPLFAPRVIEFMLVSCGLCNAHAPSPGLLQHLLARVDQSKSSKALADDPAWKLVHIALRQCPDLPEKQMVEVLQFQLSHYAGRVDQLFDVGSQAADDLDEMMDPVAVDVMQTVAAIASANGSDDMLRLALAHLPLNHAACVIRLLIKWMRAWTMLGANVEMAASSRFAQSANTAPRHASAEDDDALASPISEAIARAHKQTQQPPDGVPAVDASLTIFKKPEELPREADAGASIVRVFTRKWAPGLTLPQELACAPELGQVVDMVALVLDAHLTNILLSSEFSGLISQLTQASDMALSISDQLKLLRMGLIPFHMAWEKQQEKRAVDDLAAQKQALGLDEVVLQNGTTRSQAEQQSKVQPNAKCAQGTGPAGTYWERVQKLEQYRVEVMHWYTT
ncbi:hypothetical protein GGF46_001366 [Coemansia sp. RSA 552]|nr:hypothetical protein GGF46_001366 [Coemansia sp. RSA 552]